MHMSEKDWRRHQADLTLTVRGEQSTGLPNLTRPVSNIRGQILDSSFAQYKQMHKKHPEEHRSTVMAVNATLKEQMHQHLRCLSQQCGWRLSYTAGTRCTLCYSVSWDLNAFRHIL